MSPMRSILPALAGTVAVALLPGGAAAGQWSHPGGDAWAQRRGETALIDPSAGAPPTVLWGLPIEDRSLPTPFVWPIGPAQTIAVIVPIQGRVVALRPQDGSWLWYSPVLGATDVLGVADLDGDGAEDELVVSSSAVGGRIDWLDVETGVQLGSLGGLPDRSGLDPAEYLLTDLDGDGRAELAFPSSIYNADDLFVVRWEGGAAELAQWTFGGYNNWTPLSAGDFLGSGEGALALHQGHHYTVFEPCDAQELDAACTAAAGPCWCPTPTILQVHANYAFGPSWTVDTDGDGIDELLRVADDATLLRAVGLLDLKAGLDAGSGAGARRWTFDYSAATPRTVVRESGGGPTDLDGDGDLDLLLSFFHNDGSETDGGGGPADDGIDHPLGYSWGIFDVATGALVLSQTDAWAWGHTDLDGNGVAEIVTSETAGDGFLPGTVAWELDCGGGPCSLLWSWEDTIHSGSPTWEALGPLAPPGGAVGRADHDGDGGYEPVLWDGSRAVLVDLPAGGGDAGVVISFDLGDGASTRASRGMEGVAVVSDGSIYGVFGPLVGSQGPTREVPPSGWSPWSAPRLVAGTGRAVPILDAATYRTLLAPGSPADADHELLHRMGIAEDLDGDTLTEVLSYRQPTDLDGAGLALRADAHMPPLGWTTRWSIDTDNTPELALATFAGTMPLVTGRFGGDATRDVAAAVRLPTGPHLAFFDGASGALLALVPTGTAPGNQSPLLATDLLDADGNPGEDGLDEIVVNGVYAIEVVSVPLAAVQSNLATGCPHVVSAWVQVDADPAPELLSTTSVNIQNRAELHDFVDGEPVPLWAAPVTLGRPAGGTEVLAILADGAGNPTAFLYLNGDAGLEARSFADGALLPGFPIHLSAAGVSTVPDPAEPAPRAMLVLDVNDDGADDAVVATGGSALVAVSMLGDATGPGVLWSFPTPAPVASLAAADVDGDGLDELLAAMTNGRSIVVGAAARTLGIDVPLAEACIPGTPFRVSGTSSGLFDVRVSAGGPAESAVVGPDGSWAADVEIVGGGEHELLVEGRLPSGEVAIVDRRWVAYEGDVDGDSWAPCGGDCDDGDPDRSPTTEDICEDGVDQDCNGIDPLCPPQEPTPDEQPTPPPDGGEPPGSGCLACETAGPSSLEPGIALALLLVGVRRRHRSTIRPHPSFPPES